MRGGALGEVDEEQFGGELDDSSVELQTGAGPREWLTSIIGESDVLTVPGRGSGEQRDMLDARSSPISFRRRWASTIKNFSSGLGIPAFNDNTSID